MVKESQAAPLKHQIILTTSMMNPKLDQKEFVIGPYYAKATNRTLSNIEPSGPESSKPNPATLL